MAFLGYYLVAVAGRLCQPPRNTAEAFARVESVNTIVMPRKTCRAFGFRRNSLATPKPSSRWISTESIVPLEPTSDATDLNRVE